VLRLLGVLDTPADFKKITKRLDDLRNTPVSPVILTTVSTLYQVLDRIVARCTSTDRAEIETLFAKAPLVVAADQTWQTSGELSIFPGDDEEPDLATFIHPAFQGLSMWPRIGVSQHPSLARSLDWLHTLKSGQRLDGVAYKRVRRALSRDSLRIWEDCGHWMSLDGTWEPIARFAYRFTMQALVQFAHLTPGVRQSVADLRPVATHLLQLSPFAGLMELADALETRITHFVPGGQEQLNPRWLELLADSFRRIKNADADKQGRMRAAGERLMRTRLQVAHELEVTPYLDKAPAGSASPAKVAWIDRELYVLDDSAGRMHRPLVEELSRPFGSDDIGKAFDSCAGRDADFIADYVGEHFALDDLAGLPLTESGAISPQGPTAADHTPEILGPLPPAEKVDLSPHDEPGESEDDKDSAEPSAPPPKQRPAPEPSVFDRYAASLGFRFSGNGYSHPDGRLIVKSSAPFHWELVDSRGSSIRRYWTSRDCLEKGIEVPAELWTFTHQSPGDVTWVVASEDRGAVAITGHELIAQTAAEVLRLYPASYRLMSVQSEL
jgi:hypothetical protein